MVIDEDQLKELKELFGEIAVAKEGGVDYVLIKNAPLPVGCSPERCDLLFCSASRDGYQSRLYFDQHVNGPGVRNWTPSTRILDRIWHVYSWKFSHSSYLRVAQAIQAHLRAFRQ